MLVSHTCEKTKKKKERRNQRVVKKCREYAVCTGKSDIEIHKKNRRIRGEGKRKKWNKKSENKWRKMENIE